MALAKPPQAGLLLSTNQSAAERLSSPDMLLAICGSLPIRLKAGVCSLSWRAL